MNEYREGDRVRITIDAVIVNTYPHTRLPDANGQVATDHVVVYRTDAQEGQSSSVALEDPAVTIERVAPAEWPPRPGDLWRDQRGGVWFAADLVNDGGGPAIYMLASHDDHQVVPDYCSEKYGPLTLVHREDEQDGSTR